MVKVLASAREDREPEIRQTEDAKEQIEGLPLRNKGKRRDVSLDEDRSMQAAQKVSIWKEKHKKKGKVFTFFPCLLASLL
jgi:hypothetical protein